MAAPPQSGRNPRRVPIAVLCRDLVFGYGCADPGWGEASSVGQDAVKGGPKGNRKKSSPSLDELGAQCPYSLLSVLLSPSGLLFCEQFSRSWFLRLMRCDAPRGKPARYHSVKSLSSSRSPLALPIFSRSDCSLCQTGFSFSGRIFRPSSMTCPARSGPI